MHIGSPAGQILNLSVNQMEEQLWLWICKTSGELLGSTECRALLKTHPPLQTATKTSFSKVSWGSGKHNLFGAGGNRAGDEALLCKYGMWHWNEELQGKGTEERVSRGMGCSRGSDSMEAVSDWPCQIWVFYRSHLLPQKQWALTETPTAGRAWVSKILKGSNNEKKCSFISVQHPPVLQHKPLAAGETLYH